MRVRQRGVPRGCELANITSCTFHAHFQDALRRCKRLSMDKRDISLKLSIGLQMQEMKMQLLFKCNSTAPGNLWAIFLLLKSRKQWMLWKKNEVKNITFKCIEWRYIYGLGEFKYVASVTITKLNKWLPTDKNYQYNDFL